ncbi:streptolysin associated protein SagD [Vallitalea longa]|uniref:Streptolysin associated protein SagD n=2 Tax=Vallitalea longa TaxID=2936439 RepID=A0A9W5YIM9_9FIRM|nr:streptolysin associated protein SagD [Vallitalea longa]
MMIRFYPTYEHIMNQYRYIGGNQTGIMHGVLAPMVHMPPEPCLKSITGRMPNYHKITYNDPQKHVEYHLSGYGIYNEEALIKLIGESVERYAPICTEKIMRDRIVYSSYREMTKIGKVMPLKYLNIFSGEQQKILSKIMPVYSPQSATEDDIIGWIKCASLVHPNEDVWVPMQLLSVGFVKNKENNEKFFAPAFSTGTASHTSLKKALLNSLIEYVQIDAFIISWYTMRKVKRVVIDDEDILQYLESCGLGKDSPYEVIPLLVTLPDMDLPVYLVVLKRKDEKMPYLIVGTQGDLNAKNGILRGTMEATAIIFMHMFNALFDMPKIDFSINESAFADLDTNVLFYGVPNKVKEIDNLLNQIIEGTIKLSEIESRWENDVDAQISHLIKEISKVSEYAVYVDITPPEVIDKGWSVVRTFIPELCAMCLPGFPFENHPRLKEYGGVINEYPHPLP